MENFPRGIILLILVILFGLIKFLIPKKRIEKQKIPSDIIKRINDKFSNEKERNEVKKIIIEIKNESINVGHDQLIRSILLIADDNVDIIKEIMISNYYGDPRDVILKAMSIPGNTNDHGLTPF